MRAFGSSVSGMNARPVICSKASMYRRAASQRTSIGISGISPSPW